MSENGKASSTSGGGEQKLLYDPLVRLMEYYEGRKAASRDVDRSGLPVEERLKGRIIDGDRIGLDDDLDEAMKQYRPLEIINTFLLDGMKVVGELFGSGKMQLPFVLQSAETMKAAVAHLEPHMEKTDDSARGTMVIATVKGDVHDIGKNLVDIILTNNGYRVVNLGIKIPIDQMLDAVEESKADVLGMSGLLVKSTLVMKENLQIMTDRGIDLPVVLGGAALNRRYVDDDLASIYGGDVRYAEDAFAGLRFMDELAGVSESTKDKKNEATESTPAEEAHPTLDISSITTDDEVSTILELSGGRLLPGDSSDPRGLVATLDGAIVGGALLHSINDATDLVDPLVLTNEGSRSGGLKILVDAILTSARTSGTGRLLLPIDAGDKRRLMLLRALKFRPATDDEVAEFSAITGEVAATLLVTELASEQSDSTDEPTTSDDTTRSDVAILDELPEPPFWGSRVVDNVPLDKTFEYINEVALFRGQWGIRKGSRSAEEYRDEIERDIRPRFEELKLVAKRERLLEPRVLYGYFPVRAEGRDIVVYRPADIDESALHGEWSLPSRSDLSESDLVEWHRFSFPRQRQGRRLAIADFFAPAESGRFDILPVQVVTVGDRASEYAAGLFESGEYTDYLFFHGLSVETAEALAEYWHRSVRIELGIDGDDAEDIRKLFSQGYRGSRYSFGYPACPDLEDQVGIFRLLDPSRIGVGLSDEYMLEPEQSTSAIVVHHPEAKYFSV